jgi:hypothetical protein
MTGHSDIPEHEANDILREFVEKIVYTRLGKEMEVKVIWK